MIKQFGQVIISGGKTVSLTSVSLPVYLFQPRSYLERITDNWCFLPHYMKKANEAKDPLERFKWIVTFMISSLHNTCTQLKPFNPILGETYEASFEDGTQIFMEQSSHHPPVSNFEVFPTDNSWKMYGHAEATAQFGANKITGRQVGPVFIEFQDGTKIEFELPSVVISGFLFGERIMEFIEICRFRDRKNNLALDLQFAPPAPPSTGFFSWFTTKKPPSDYITGNIVQTSSENGEPKEGDKVLSVLSGSWLGCVKFENEVFWDWTDENNGILKKYPIIPSDDPLPSDSRYRADLIYLGKDDIQKSQEWKGILEVKQRKEEKGRKEFEKNRTKPTTTEKKGWW